MSHPLSKAEIFFSQRLLKNGAVYDGPLDGLWSPAIEDAEEAMRDLYNAAQKEFGVLDARSEKNIATLLPQAQRKAREFMDATRNLTLTYRIISGTRTYGEQDALYAIGRTVEPNRRKVTKARGGQSNHNFGLAWDVGIFDGPRYYTGDTEVENAAYVALGRHVENIDGLEWGGNWTSFVDKPHYQLAVKQERIADVRAAFEDGSLSIA